MKTIKYLNTRKTDGIKPSRSPSFISLSSIGWLAFLLITPWFATDANAIVFCLKANKPNKVTVRALQCKKNEITQPLVSEGRSFSSADNVLNFIQDTDQTVASLDLPAGKWVITAKLIANNNDSVVRQFNCSLQLGGIEIDNLFPDQELDIGLSDDDRNVVTLTGSGTLDASGTVDVICQTNSPSGNWLSRSITAVQVQNLN